MKRSKATILVVDDNIDDLLFMQAAFRAAGVASIQTADSGAEAIAYLSGGSAYADRGAYPYPDFLITDLKMSNGDGFAVLEYCRANPTSAIIPTVVFSGSKDNDDIKKAYLLGAQSYHVKPSSHTLLRGVVKTLCEYWLSCEVPDVDGTGKQVATDSSHKLGQRFD